MCVLSAVLNSNDAQLMNSKLHTEKNREIDHIESGIKQGFLC